MNGELIVAAGGLAITILGTVVAVTRALVKAPLEAEKAALGQQVSQIKQDQLDERSRFEREIKEERSRLEQDLKEERSRSAENAAKYEQLVDDFEHWKSGRGSAVMIRDEIDADLRLSMTAINATASSVLVQAPKIHPESLLFLSVFGSAAPKLRKMILPVEKGIAGKVFKTGVLINTGEPYREKEFFAGVDRKVESKTENMLTVPLKWSGSVVGVAQFLNKSNGDMFSDAEVKATVQRSRSLAEKVGRFVQNPSNFEILPVVLDSATNQATLLFCDLSASHLLFDRMDGGTAIRFIDEYLNGQAGIALRHGATIDKYLGDGIMIRFNVPMRIVDGDHAMCAVEAAWEMNREFERMKQSWLDIGLGVRGIYGRIGLASGPVYSEVMGHPQLQTITIIGRPVNVAANLCEAAQRDRSVIMADETVAARARARDWVVQPAPDEVVARLKSPAKAAFEIAASP